MNKESYPIKLVLIGDDGVGKTCLYWRKGYKNFPTDYIPTVFDGFVDNIYTHDGYICNIAFWDTVASEEYSQLRPLSYPQTDVLAILFSISNRNSFENCLNKWYPESQLHLSNNVPIILVGTKSDLKNNSTADKSDFIKYEEGVEMANKINAIQYIETSSLNDTNISQLFELVCKVGINKINNSNQKSSNLNKAQDIDSDEDYNKKKCIIN